MTLLWRAAVSYCKKKAGGKEVRGPEGVRGSVKWKNLSPAAGGDGWILDREQRL